MSRSPVLRIAALCLLALLFRLPSPGGNLAHAASGYTIAGVSLRQEAKGVTIEVKGNAVPTYTVYELVDPLRLVLDIADAGIGPDVHLPITQIRGPVAIVSGRVITEQNPPLARLEILLNEDAGYAVNRRDNDIVLTVNSVKAGQNGRPAGASGKAALAAVDPVAGIIASASAGDAAQKPAEAGKTPAAETEKAKEGGKISTAEVRKPFAGYDEKLISVDFFKIDLHNVFRLIGEVSGKNIVVDEGVGGSLTLALENVPWDFALDVIMNLKGLQKEERYDTIVISPKDKEFTWPKLPVAEGEGGEVGAKAEPLTVTPRLETPQGQIAARQIISQARQKEEAGDAAGARELYEKAFARWPDNGELATRIAASLLVNEQKNARAVHYAKEAMRLNADDYEAALIAAIGLANMKKDAEAKEYFDRAVSGVRPSSAALQSYAAFLEDGGDYPEALVMLARHEDLHGDTLETMIARARLFDKNGDYAMASQTYRAALLSGYQLPPDLEQYIRARLDFAGRK